MYGQGSVLIRLYEEARNWLWREIAFGEGRKNGNSDKNDPHGGSNALVFLRSIGMVGAGVSSDGGDNGWS